MTGHVFIRYRLALFGIETYRRCSLRVGIVVLFQIFQNRRMRPVLGRHTAHLHTRIERVHIRLAELVFHPEPIPEMIRQHFMRTVGSSERGRKSRPIIRRNLIEYRHIRVGTDPVRLIEDNLSDIVHQFLRQHANRKEVENHDRKIGVKGHFRRIRRQNDRRGISCTTDDVFPLSRQIIRRHQNERLHLQSCGAVNRTDRLPVTARHLDQNPRRIIHRGVVVEKLLLVVSEGDPVVKRRASSHDKTVRRLRLPEVVAGKHIPVSLFSEIADRRVYLRIKPSLTEPDDILVSRIRECERLRYFLD